METLISDLSAPELRKLMIGELKQFILLLDRGTIEELQLQKAYLSEIFARLSEKEQEEVQHLISLVAEISTPAHMQVRSHNATILPVFDPSHSNVSSSPIFDDSAPTALQQSA